jgi:L-threonylcarbamoyladenylate synthase
MKDTVRVSGVIDARKESHARVVEEVANIIFAGGTVIFPTDTVYGIGCDPYNVAAVERIYGAKDRPASKPLSLHVATLAEFMEYAKPYREIMGVARRLMPGPVTIIIPKPSFIDHEVSAGLRTLGFRVPDDALCSQILERCGPLSATSANTSGQSPYYGAGEWEALPPADLLVENGLTKHQRDSTVIDMTGTQPVVLREGVVSVQRLTELLGPALRPLLSLRKTQ